MSERLAEVFPFLDAADEAVRELHENCCQPLRSPRMEMLAETITAARQRLDKAVDAESGGGGFAEGSGNEAMFEVRDDETLIVRNDTCADFYLRVVATTFGGEPAEANVDASTPDAGR